MRLLTPLALAALTIIALPVVNAQTFPSTGGPFPVADGGGATSCGVPGAATLNTITINSGGFLSDVDIMVDIAASWVGDVDAVVSAGGTSVAIVDNPGTATETGCGSGEDNMPGVFLDDEADAANTAENGPFPFVAATHYVPNNPLSAFDGQSVTGDWTLSVTDAGAGDATALNAWAVVATMGGGVANEGTPLPDGYSFDLSGANPSSTTTQFSLAVAETQDVSVVIYDMMGRQVQDVFARTLRAGQTAFMSVNVASLSPGVYVARATGAGFMATQSFTVVR